ncbi:hypothetical protein ACVWYG_002029 [Pedobacter sp. UYEF25]
MNHALKRFLLIDDDPMRNFISERILENPFEKVNTDHFTVPSERLEFIRNNSDNDPTDEKKVLFLDINIPLISG